MRVACVQMNSQSDKAANVAAATDLVRRAAAAGARLIVLPETWTFKNGRAALAAAAEAVTGRATACWPRSPPSSTSTSWPVRSTRRAPGPTASATRACFSTPRARRSPCTARSTCSMRSPARRCIASPTTCCPAIAWSRATSTACRSASRSATTCGSPSCIGPSPCAARRSWRCPRPSPTPPAAPIGRCCCAPGPSRTAALVAAGQWGVHGDDRRCYGHSMIVDPWGTVLTVAADGVAGCATPSSS